MEAKYNPYFLMLNTVISVKKAEMPARIIRKEGFKDLMIQIDLNSKNQEPLIIADGPYQKGEPLSFLQGDTEYSEDIIEQRKDELKRVTVFYRGEEYLSFDNFADYLNWLGIN